MTTGPPAGPTSAYPTSRTPALICFNGPNDVLPGLIPSEPVGFAPSGCAFAEPIVANGAAASVMAAPPRKRRRWRLTSLDILLASIGRSPWLSDRFALRPAGLIHLVKR